MRAGTLSALATALGLLALGGAWLVGDVERFMKTPMDVPAEGYSLLVERGGTLREVADRLAADRLLSRPLYLVYRARWDGRDRRIRAGEYLLPAGATPSRLLEMMVDGEVVHHSVTLVEGWTWRRALAEIRSHPKVRRTLGDDVPGSEVARALDLPSPDPEGWFLPDTYLFPRGTEDLELLRTAHRAMLALLDAEWPGRAEGLPYEDRYRALVLASIVEKETGVPEERARVAGVFVRRLQRGMPLEADPTVIYGLGSGFDGRLTRRDLRRDTPYNTYLHRGLTPTPIALPGAAALRAALHPADGDELFFVASGDGGHVFSRTLSEHRAAVRAWRRSRGKVAGEERR